MAAARKKGEVKTPKTFKLTTEAIETIIELSEYFDDSQAEAIERAVAFLKENKELASQREHDKRVGKA